jgi:hypothetical protein
MRPAGRLLFIHPARSIPAGIAQALGIVTLLFAFSGVRGGHLPRAPCMKATGNMLVLLYVVAMIALIVAVDLLFFRNRFWQRLLVNVGIVLVFAAIYFWFLPKP